MFSMNDYHKINQTYFKIINANGYALTLRSRNTRHEWHITEQSYNNRTCSYELLHRHPNRCYHRQGQFKSFSGVIKYIQKHDKYQIEVRGR